MAIDIIARGMIESSKNDISHLFDITKGGEIVSNESSYTISNAVDYPLLGLSLYGKSVQDGTPSPDAPVDIVSVGDSGSVEFEACGKNLLDLSKCNWKTKELNGLSFTRNDNGEILVNGTATAATTVIFFDWNMKGKLPYSKLTISGCPKINVNSSTCRLQFWYSSPTAGSKQCWASSPVPECTFTLPNDCTNYNCAIYINTGYTADNIVFKPMLRPAEIADNTFESYKGSTANITTALPLCGIPVDSGGNYTDSNGQQWVCDTMVYNADGTGKIVKRTSKIGSYNGEAITTPYISTTGDLTTGATVIYALAEPQEIALTAADVSALMQLRTYSGLTDISNSGNADMDVKYCTDKSLSEYVLPVITNMQAQIDELKSAVLSLGGNI